MAARDSHPLASDLDHVLARTRGFLEELRGARLFITGGTGFFGCWLLESFLWANRELGLGATAIVLTRDAVAFAAKAPALAADPAIALWQGDVRNFSFPSGNFTHLIHAATEASARLNRQEPDLMLETIIEGTRHLLRFAAESGAGKLLLTSSGAVYGKQPPQVPHFSEETPGAPDPLCPLSAYGEGKRVSELLAAVAASSGGLEVKVARCYAFVGPYQPLDGHFAIANFIRDGLAGRPIRIAGDGTPLRSYLYAADLMIWLWTILLRGTPQRAYNVGSEETVSIRETAEAVAAEFDPRPAVEVAGTPVPGAAPACYVPSTARARAELGLAADIPLSSAIARTIGWHRHRMATLGLDSGRSLR